MAKRTQSEHVELVLNEPPDAHSDILKLLLHSAESFLCMTAFAKETGLKFIRKELKGRLAAGLKARFVLGLNFYQTDPSVLKELLSLGKRYTTLELLVSKLDTKDSAAARNFHPKVFMFKNAGGASAAIIGSANMTGGGLSNNLEASILVRDGSEVIIKRMDQHIERLIRDKQIVRADARIVNEYARRHDIYAVFKKRAERRARRAFEQRGLAVDTLKELLAEMKENKTEDGFEAQRTSRSDLRKRSQEQLNRISSSRPLSENDFLKLYEPLVARFWHSGGLARGKNVVAKHAHAFQDALQSLGTIETLSVENAFDVLHQNMQGVSRARINAMTEILHSLDNRRFAVMNQNSVSGLSRAGVTEFPKNPTKETVDAGMYAAFCKRAGDVRDLLELKNFTELDALFNYAYWKDHSE